jgi:hypothetical protein
MPVISPLVANLRLGDAPSVSYDVPTVAIAADRGTNLRSAASNTSNRIKVREVIANGDSRASGRSCQSLSAVETLNTL